MHKLEMLIFQNGERYPILMDRDGMPHFLATLWVTAKLRSMGLTVNTISARLAVLKWFFQWEIKEQRDLFSEFQQGQFLRDTDIDKIKSHLSIDIAHLKGLSSHKQTRNKIVGINSSPQLIKVTPSVGRNNIYNRLTAVAGYLDFIAKVATQYTTNPSLTAEIKNMFQRLMAKRPKGKGNNVLRKIDDKNLPDGLIEEFMAVAHYDHPKNPFKHITTRKRNHLMFILLEELGIRRGELLSLTMGANMQLFGPDKFIWVRRSHDDVNDHRKKQPVAKTRERMLPIKDETAKLIDEYIKNVRGKTPHSGKHGYLFITHHKCPSQGKPISVSTFDTIIVPAMKSVDERFKAIHPHYFRHHWNEMFSRKIDHHNKLAKDPNSNRIEITPGEEAKSRMHLMGHSSESSAKPYIERHIRKKTNKLILEEQEYFQRLLTTPQSNKESE